MRSTQWPESVTKEEALRSVTMASLVASMCALLLCGAIAIPLALLSRDFDTRTAKVIEGFSKIVAAVCILQLSLKIPKWLGDNHAKERNTSVMEDFTLRSIRFNVAWNIWREVAECGVFLLPFFLHGEGAKAIPLSAVVGSIIGALLGVAIYYANMCMQNKRTLVIFMVALLVFMSTGLLTGGCHNFEEVFGLTPVVWHITGDFWSINRLPMTILKPFGYSDTRTVLQMVCFWSWLLFSSVLHYRGQRRLWQEQAHREEQNDSSIPSSTSSVQLLPMTCNTTNLEL